MAKHFIRYDWLLVNATDKMQEYLDHMTIFRDNTVYLMEAAVIACGALGRLEDNPRFRENLEKVFERYRVIRERLRPSLAFLRVVHIP